MTAVDHDDWGRERREVRHEIASPPRQLAIGEPGWRRIGPNLKITLDGQEVSRCVAYDIEKQTVTRQRLDDAMRIFVDPETNRVAVETVGGKVEVRWK